MNLNIATVKQRNVLFYIRLLCTEEAKGSIQSIFNGTESVGFRIVFIIVDHGGIEITITFTARS